MYRWCQVASCQRSPKEWRPSTGRGRNADSKSSASPYIGLTSIGWVGPGNSSWQVRIWYLKLVTYRWERLNIKPPWIPISFGGAWVIRAIKSAKDAVYALNQGAHWKKKQSHSQFTQETACCNLQLRHWLSLSRAGIPTRRNFPFLSWYFLTKDCPGNDCMAARLIWPPIS